MITEIRDYIKSGIQAIDSDLKPNKSAFYSEDIPETTIDYTYQIEFGSISLETRSDYRDQSIPIIISLFGISGVEEIEKYDSLLDKAICIRDYLIRISNFSQVEHITNVISDGINSERLPSDDNTFKIDINLTLSQAYSLGE